jgi:uncharacterized membrane protein
MLAVIIGFATALVYGFADFFGAIASQRLRSVLVTGLAGWAGLLLLLAAVTIGGFHAEFSQPAIFWGLLGGVFSTLGLSCLYKALSIGPISIVSPLSALVGGLIPTVIGVAFLGEKFGLISWLAIVLILVAVVLVASSPQTETSKVKLQGIMYGLGAGSGIGGVLVCLHMAPARAGLAPVILMRVENGVLLGGFALLLLAIGKAKPAEFKGLSARIWMAIFATGLLDAFANVLFVVGRRLGSLTVISVLTVLYPAGTILLARIVLKEKLALRQSLGIVLALGASMLLAI